MTIVRQLLLLASCLVLMGCSVYIQAPGYCFYVLAYVGGFVVSRYDDGAVRDPAPA